MATITIKITRKGQTTTTTYGSDGKTLEEDKA